MGRVGQVPHNKIFITNENEIIEQYAHGKSILALSKEFKLCRSTIARVIKGSNVTYRSQSEAETIKWQGMTAEQKHKQVCNAHAKVRGSKRRIEELELRARSAYANPFKTGNFEMELSELLNVYFKTERQFPLHKYNIDIAIPELKVAIEIQSSNQTLIRQPANAERSQYICSKGWFLIYVIFKQADKVNNVMPISNGLIKSCKNLSEGSSVLGSYGFLSTDGNPYKSNIYDIPGLTRVF